MSREPKNDEAWVKLFEKYEIVKRINEEGQFVITADQIKEFREPRLMTKFDSRTQLPAIFDESKLSILPITRGSYSISNYKVYHKFEEVESPIIEVSYPDYVQSINWDEISSESTAINVAFISNMLEAFLDEKGLLPTVNGRMGSKEFDFEIYNSRLKRNQRIEVKNSQIEIDGGFEGIGSLTLVEAKNVLSEDFLVRQLYYPYRLWSQKVTKPVRPIYLTYSNNVFSLYEYTFENPKNYNSLVLLKAKRYTLGQELISLQDIISISNSIVVVPEDDIPFVQADSFYRVINLCELLIENEQMTVEDIANEFGFATRQSDYYFNAGKYIGLFEKRKSDQGIVVVLTDHGKSIMNMSVRTRNLTLVRSILSHGVFREVFQYYLANQRYPELNELIEIMKKYPISMGEGGYELYKRRSSSITGWINWIFSLISE
jgi:hypothetical protein